MEAAPAKKKKIGDQAEAYDQPVNVTATEKQTQREQNAQGAKTGEQKFQEAMSEEKINPAMRSKEQVGTTEGKRATKPIGTMTDDEVNAAAAGGSLGAVVEKRKRGLK